MYGWALHPEGNLGQLVGINRVVTFTAAAKSRVCTLFKKSFLSISQEYLSSETRKLQETKHNFPGLANDSDCIHVHAGYMTLTKNYSNTVAV